jgi:choline dehydrogenase-like flavoprotein
MATTGWTERELATLAAVAETFVRGDAVRRARLATAGLDAAADPAQIAQLRLVLRLLESRAANLVLARLPAAFASMSPVARERYLLGWATSRLPMRRAAFSSLRKLLTFLAYADPGADGTNPRHAAIGYQPEWPPTTADPTPIRPFALPEADGDGRVTFDADVVVVGSGAGGGVVAAALAEAGRSVVVLEAGPFVDETTMPTNELDAFDRLYLNHGLTTTWDGSVTMLAGAGVGGGTLVNWMTTIPAPAAVRDDWRREHGLDGLGDGAGEAWADDVATLERELDATETAVLPPKDAAIIRGATVLGWEAAPTVRDAGACDACGSCPFGCRAGSKQSGIRVHLARAFRAGARIVPDAHVERVLLDGGRVTGVVATAGAADGAPARTVVVRAPQVVVAAGALRSPAVLQRSGLAHSAIGRHLRLHPVPVVAGRLPHPVEMWRGPMQGARSAEFLAAASGRNGYVIEAAPGHPGLIALALPWEGTEAHARVMGEVRHLAPLIAVTRDGGEGRTRLTKAGNVRVDYALDASGAATMRHAAIRMARLSRAAGATDIVVAATPPLWFHAGGSGPGADDAAFERYLERLEGLDVGPNRASVFSAHQMGTIRMGADPRDHPCDPGGRVRADARRDTPVGGLYVADTSLFPTGIGVNPMLTAMALARRVARTVLAEG